MLILSNLIPFASGGEHHCFIHPDDPTLCLKILRSGRNARAERGRKHWIKSWFRSDAYYDRDIREFTEYRRLDRIGDEIIWRHIPRHYGFVDTDLGRAAAIQLVRNADGSIARTLEGEINRGNIPHDALREFYSFLDLGYLCNFRDRQIINVVCARLEGGNFRLFIVDGLKSSGSFLSVRGKKQAMKYAERFKSQVSDLIKSQNKHHEIY